MRTLRRINDSSIAKAVEPVRRAVKASAWLVVDASLVRESGRYVVNTFRRSREPRRYHLRRNRSSFYLRHHTGDVAIFRKFAAYRDYEFPPEVAEKLKGKSVTVVDLGANIGLFGVHTRSCADVAGIVSFEPDPENADVVERVIGDYGGSWKLIRACASIREGEVRFGGGKANLSRISEDGDLVPMVDAVPYLLAADIAKINIEGAEWDILSDERFATGAPEVLILEYHAFSNPEKDIHALVKRLLAEAGYSNQLLVDRSEENGLIWGWKPSQAHVSAATPPEATVAS
jgi:FkbM family methyltransferase